MKWALPVLAGAVVLTVCDHLHVVFGVLRYPHPDLGRQAWWVPLLFAGACAVALVGARLMRAGLGGARPLASAGALAGDAVGFVGAYAFTSLGKDAPDAALLALVAFWLAQALRGRPAWVVAYSLLLALCGPAFEAGWSALGLFAYVRPDFAGVPRWLPGVYLHAGLLATTLEARLAS
jgi:hypothetical protein